MLFLVVEAVGAGVCRYVVFKAPLLRGAVGHVLVVDFGIAGAFSSDFDFAVAAVHAKRGHKVVGFFFFFIFLFFVFLHVFYIVVGITDLLLSLLPSNASISS